jgi:glycosyltransferase involved in cell wall biosynthesis
VEVPSAKNDRTAPSDSDWLRFRDAPSPKFLYVGRLIAGKAVETLIEAAVKATEAGARATYAIVGEGPEMQRLRARVREARASYIIFGGSRAPSQIGAWLSETDGLVLPSLSEGRPVVVIEAMASARAVVASDLPGIRELVIDGVTGVLFPAGDAESLASAFARLVHNPWILGEMGVSAARSFDNERLSAAASAHDHIEMYKELVRPVPASS